MRRPQDWSATNSNYSRSIQSLTAVYLARVGFGLGSRAGARTPHEVRGGPLGVPEALGEPLLEDLASLPPYGSPRTASLRPTVSLG